MTRIWKWPGLVFVLVILWKILLAIFTTQPIPANDSFFYDGPVVNYLVHGAYVNPSLSHALPISANEVFSAYPPFYHVVLLPWMKLFGTSAKSAIYLHVALFGVYAALVYLVLRRLGAPLTAMRFAGLFLFGITFHDRPDSLAHVLGAGAILAWANANADPVNLSRAKLMRWVAAVAAVLCLTTSLQIGATYSTALVMCMGAQTICYAPEQTRIPGPLSQWGPILAIILIPLVLVGVVLFACPRCWAGFVEHARQTPTFLGFRMIQPADLLKVVRTVPGVLLCAAILIPLLLWKTSGKENSTNTAAVRGSTREGPGFMQSAAKVCNDPARLLLLVLVAASLLVIAASLTALAANVVAIANYLQPVIIGLVFAAIPRLNNNWNGRIRSLLILSVLLVSVRAIGMSTWGVLLASDFGYKDALKATAPVLEQARPTQTAVVSAAFLYDAAVTSKARLVHSDWLAPARPHGEEEPLTQKLRRVKPTLMVLTQFDYYRNYAGALRVLKAEPREVTVIARNRAILPAPDSSPLLQRVVQHISWAPVIVEMTWHD